MQLALWDMKNINSKNLTKEKTNMKQRVQIFSPSRNNSTQRISNDDSQAYSKEKYPLHHLQVQKINLVKKLNILKNLCRPAAASECQPKNVKSTSRKVRPT